MFRNSELTSGISCSGKTGPGEARLSSEVVVLAERRQSQRSAPLRARSPDPVQLSSLREPCPGPNCLVGLSGHPYGRGVLQTAAQQTATALRSKRWGQGPHHHPAARAGPGAHESSVSLQDSPICPLGPWWSTWRSAGWVGGLGRRLGPPFTHSLPEPSLHWPRLLGLLCHWLRLLTWGMQPMQEQPMAKGLH